MINKLAKMELEEFSNISGIRLINTLPKSAPTARLINRLVYFFTISSLSESEKTPIKRNEAYYDDTSECIKISCYHPSTKILTNNFYSHTP